MLIEEVHAQPRVDEHMFIMSDWAAPLRQLEFDARRYRCGRFGFPMRTANVAA